MWFDLFTGCANYQPLLTGNIKIVHILFKNKPGNYAYNLYDHSIVHWDKKNIGIRRALNNYRNKRSFLKKEGPNYLASFFAKKSQIRANKSSTLNEFAYIEMNSGQLIFYGLMRDTFIDLTTDKVHY